MSACLLDTIASLECNGGIWVKVKLHKALQKCLLRLVNFWSCFYIVSVATFKGVKVNQYTSLFHHKCFEYTNLLFRPLSQKRITKYQVFSKGYSFWLALYVCLYLNFRFDGCGPQDGQRCCPVGTCMVSCCSHIAACMLGELIFKNDTMLLREGITL